MHNAKEKRVFISIPKIFLADLEKNYQLEHGLVVMQLNAIINEGYLQAYFRTMGKVTGCKIIKNYVSEDRKAMGFVRFASAEEADKAEMAGPHLIANDEVVVRRVVSPKMVFGDDLVLRGMTSRTMSSGNCLGLGYIFEDAQWLDREKK